MPSTLGIVSSGYYNRPMWIAVSGAVTDYLMAYPFDTYTGFGSKIAAPSSSPPTTTQSHVSWSPDNTIVLTGQLNTSPYVNAWAWSSGSWGSKYSNPASITADSHKNTVFNPQGTDVISSVGSSSATTADAWAWSSGWGTKYASPIISNGQNDGTFVLNGTAVIYGIINATTGVVAYPFTSGTGFGTKYSDPATLPTTQGQSIAWDENTQTVITSQGNTSPYVNAYPFSSSGWGTRFTITSAFTTNVVEIAFDKRGESAFFFQSTPTRRAWSASGFGSNLTAPAGGLTTSASTMSNSVSVDNSTFVQVSGGASPYIKAWPIRSSTTMGTAFTAPADISLSSPRWVKFSN